MKRVAISCVLCGQLLVAAETPPEIKAIEAEAARNAAMSPAERNVLRDQAIRAVASFELMPPEIRTEFPARYLKKNLTFAMNYGAAVTPGGRVWAVWDGGEDGLKSFLVGAWSDDGGKTWSDTKIVVDSHFKNDDFGFLKIARNHQVANVWCLDDGKLRLTVFQSMQNWIGRGGTWEFVCENPDAEHPVWSKPRYLFPGSAHNKPLRARDGTWYYFNDYELYGHSFPELERFKGCGVYATRDGQAFERRGFTRPADSLHWAEHSAVERQDGSLWMLLRTGNGLMESFSTDRGERWTTPRPMTTLRTCVTRFVFLPLQSGRILAVKNGDVADVAPRGREKLSAFITEDEGKSWKGPLVLDERTGVAYPDAFQFPDGSIGLTYDRNRTTDAEILFARFTEEDILAGHIVCSSSFVKVPVVSCTAGKN